MDIVLLLTNKLKKQEIPLIFIFMIVNIGTALTSNSSRMNCEIAWYYIIQSIHS